MLMNGSGGQYITPKGKRQRCEDEGGLGERGSEKRLPHWTCLLKWKRFLCVLESPQGAGMRGNQQRQLWLLGGAGQGEQEGREERDEECHGEEGEKWVC